MLPSTMRYYPRARALVSARSRNYDVAPCPRVENEAEQTRGGRPPASVPTSMFEGDGHEASPPRISACRCGCRRAPGRRGARERAELPHAAGAPDPRLSRGRVDRLGGAHHGGVAFGAARAVRGRREQAGGRHQSRGPDRGQLAARRLHAPVRDHHQRDQRNVLPDAAVQLPARHRPGCRARGFTLCHGGEPVGAGQDRR